MLHPDRAVDEVARRAAEAQMRRLNEIMAVLGNPRLRQQYDAALRDALVAPGCPVEVTRPRWSAMIWLSAGLLCAGALGWFVMTNVADLEPSASDPEEPPAPQFQAQTSQVQTKSPNRALKSKVARRSDPLPLSSPHALDVSQPTAPAKPAISNQPVAGMPGLDSIPSIPPNSDSLATQAAPVLAELRRITEPRPTVAGTWLYVPEEEEAEGMYAPEYIELVVTEDGSILRGWHKGRYRVTDRAISHSVDFQFEGQAAADELEWKGAGGTRGRLRLTLNDAQLLEVEWWVTQMGSGTGLAAGKATLVRLREP